VATRPMSASAHNATRGFQAAPWGTMPWQPGYELNCWSCPRCTVVNHIDLRYCGMCGSGRDGALPPQVAAGKDSGCTAIATQDRPAGGGSFVAQCEDDSDAGDEAGWEVGLAWPEQAYPEIRSVDNALDLVIGRWRDMYGSMYEVVADAPTARSRVESCTVSTRRSTGEMEVTLGMIRLMSEGRVVWAQSYELDLDSTMHRRLCWVHTLPPAGGARGVWAMPRTRQEWVWTRENESDASCNGDRTASSSSSSSISSGRPRASAEGSKPQRFVPFEIDSAVTSGGSKMSRTHFCIFEEGDAASGFSSWSMELGRHRKRWGAIFGVVQEVARCKSGSWPTEVSASMFVGGDVLHIDESVQELLNTGSNASLPSRQHDFARPSSFEETLWNTMGQESQGVCWELAGRVRDRKLASWENRETLLSRVDRLVRVASPDAVALVLDQSNAEIAYDDLVQRGRGHETPSCQAFVLIFVRDSEKRGMAAEGLSRLVVDRFESRLGTKRVAKASLGATTFTAQEIAAFLSLEHSRGGLARAIAGVQASVQPEPVTLAGGTRSGPVLRQVDDLLRDYQQRRRHSVVGDRKVHFDLPGEEGKDENRADDDENDADADDDDDNDDNSITSKSAQASTMSPLTGIPPASPAARRGLGPPPSSAPPPPPMPTVVADHGGITRSVLAAGKEVTGKSIWPDRPKPDKQLLPAPQAVEAEQVQAQAFATSSPSAVAAVATAPAALENCRKGVSAGSRAATTAVAKAPRSSIAATTIDVGRQARSQGEEISCRSGGNSGKDKAVLDGTAAFSRALKQHNVRRSESSRKSKTPVKAKLDFDDIPPKPPLLTELWGWLKGVAAIFDNFMTSLTEGVIALLSGCVNNPKTVLVILLLLYMMKLLRWLHTVEPRVQYIYDPHSYGSYPGWGYARGSYNPDAYYEYLMALQAMQGAHDENSEEYRKAMEELWSRDGWDSRQLAGGAAREAMPKDSSDFCPAPSELELLRKAFTGQTKSRNRRPMCKLKAAAPPSR